MTTLDTRPPAPAPAPPRRRRARGHPGLGAGSSRGRGIAPIWGRLADVLEWLALMSVVPLVLGVCGTYAWIMNVANPH